MCLIPTLANLLQVYFVENPKKVTNGTFAMYQLGSSTSESD